MKIGFECKDVTVWNVIRWLIIRERMSVNMGDEYRFSTKADIFVASSITALRDAVPCRYKVY